MYFGHLIFTAGLALALRSPLAALFLVERCWRFDRRARQDEVHLLELFGEQYAAYLRRVKRWLPGLL
jgi:protein-S-isoprenylcysteine O-methyltransferase Ste14